MAEIIPHRKPQPSFSFENWEAPSERTSLILAVQFILAVALIVFELQFTLLPLLSASKILIGFGLLGFMLSYFVRDRLGLSIWDGMMYNVFLISPWIMVVFLTINATCTQIYQEKHRVKSSDLSGDRYEFELENDVYEEFWRIRTVQIESRHARSTYVTYTFCDGILGYKVVKEIELN